MDKTGTTWISDLPCPWCKKKKVLGYLYVTEEGDHQQAFSARGYEIYSLRKGSEEPRTNILGEMILSLSGFYLLDIPS